jgi:hypothetical protein
VKISKNGVNTSGVHQKRADRRLQHQVRFNLNLRRDDENWLAGAIAELRSRRQFRPTIIKALTLFFDLKAGYLDVLYELFPDAVQRIQASYQNAEIEALRREIAELRAQGIQTPGPAASAAPAPSMKLTKGIAASTGKAFANSIGGYFD